MEDTEGNSHKPLHLQHMKEKGKASLVGKPK